MHAREVSILLLIILSQASLSNSWAEPAVPRAARLCVVLEGVQTQLVCLGHCSPPPQEALAGFRGGE